MSGHPKLRLGLVVGGNDNFLIPIEHALHEKYQVHRFAPRFIKAPVIGSSINKVLFEVQFRRFMATHDIAFFEWAGPLLVRATHMPKRCRIITRLHSLEMALTAHLVNWSQVDTTIVVSEQMKRRLSSVAPASPKQVQVINCGIDLQRFHQEVSEFRYRIGMIARVMPIKRVYEAVLTIYALRNQGHPFSLSVGGPLDDELEPRYVWAVRELIERLNLTECVSLLGPVHDPAPFYQEIDIFLSNSFWEGQQNALLEAMASGCYCLSHCWAGAEEVLPAKQIFITDSDLQAKLLEYASSPDTTKKSLGTHMRAIAENRFDEKTMVRRVLDCIGSY